MRRIPRKLAMWGGAAALAGAGFAFMASNTFTNHPSAGVGTTSISGYTVSSTVLTGCGSTDSTNPEDICYVHFRLMPQATTAPTAGTAYVQFKKKTGGSTGWYKCTATTTYKPPRNRLFNCDLRTQATGPVFTTVTTITVSANDPLS